MNLKLSELYHFLGVTIALISVVLTISYWAMFINFSPLTIINNILSLYNYNSSNNSYGILSNFLYLIFEGISWLVLGGCTSKYLYLLSKKEELGGWENLHDYQEKKVQESYISVGNVIDVENDEGGTLTNAYVTFKTESHIFRCIGRSGSVQIGSPLVKQYNEIIAIDSGQKKRFTIAS